MYTLASSSWAAARTPEKMAGAPVLDVRSGVGVHAGVEARRVVVLGIGRGRYVHV
jgi:hypothetical protein